MSRSVKQERSVVEGKYEVTAVSRACAIIAAFGPDLEVLELPEVAARTGLHRATAFRLLSTLVQNGFLERVGVHGYRCRCVLRETRRFRVGYAEQSAVVPFISVVTESLRLAAAKAGLDLLVVNNRFSRKVALRNADWLVSQRVDLAIEFQVAADIAGRVAGKFAAANIPLLALDNPHPGAVYFGADNYRAGCMAGGLLAKWTAQNWNGAADELLLLAASIGGPILEARLRGVTDGFAAERPNLRAIPQVVLDVAAKYSTALETVRRRLRRDRAQRILVAAVNDASALAALEAFRENGREAECAVVSHDGTLEARNELRRPRTRLVGSAAYFPETYGERLIPLVLDILHSRAFPRTVFTRHVMLTPSNVDKVYPNDLLVGAVPAAG